MYDDGFAATTAALRSLRLRALLLCADVDYARGSLRLYRVESADDLQADTARLIKVGRSGPSAGPRRAVRSGAPG